MSSLFQFKTVSKQDLAVEVTLEATDGAVSIQQLKTFLDDLTIEFSGGRNKLRPEIMVSERGLTVRLESLSDDY